ncbi:MAG TPA: NAD(P)H-hydrate dehydratase [Burkholderiales bacterium]
MPSPICLTEEIRRIEENAARTTPPLMERAGAAAAELAARLVSDERKDVLVLAGPGNNGGDARIAAARLREQFFRVTLAANPGELPAMARWSLVIDGLFGIGLARDLEGDYARLVDYVNRQRCPVLALDIPSGLDSDTGRVRGCAVRATHTLTFIALKPGLLTLDGPDHCGEISVADLGVDTGPASAWVAEPALFSASLKPRPRNFHKGMAGSLAVFGGAAGMTGAALLAGRAALRLGAGRVYLGLLDQTLHVDPLAPELMIRHADDALGLDLDAMVIGPGLGTGERAETLVGAALASDLPCVLDADALNLIAENEDLRKACARRSAETLLTPHPAEAARLLGSSTAAVQADRVKSARLLAQNLNAHVVLKGAGSILVARDGHWFINRTGHAGLSTAGTGDVLAGLLGALLAQRYTGETALVLGVHLHGAAAEGLPQVGLAASELIEPARRLWNSWL